MRLDFEEQIIYNPMLGALLLWEFSYKYNLQAGCGTREFTPLDAGHTDCGASAIDGVN